MKNSRQTSDCRFEVQPFVLSSVLCQRSPELTGALFQRFRTLMLSPPQTREPKGGPRYAEATKRRKGQKPSDAPRPAPSVPVPTFSPEPETQPSVKPKPISKSRRPKRIKKEPVERSNDLDGNPKDVLKKLRSIKKRANACSVDGCKSASSAVSKCCQTPTGQPKKVCSVHDVYCHVCHKALCIICKKDPMQRCKRCKAYACKACAKSSHCAACERALARLNEKPT